ncbi:hypothetical protein BpHYR1_041138 [Brachionus plicatilis]|uniref:Uncharacterized protein n=1 Tax=Brachionus plicatilis TaxID=10195 RepID=A0A3M7PT10_BRAPC|nr:hypothetical protein BpHYR1_041138 [Brachionus plicatilis]
MWKNLNFCGDNYYSNKFGAKSPPKSFLNDLNRDVLERIKKFILFQEEKNEDELFNVKTLVSNHHNFFKETKIKIRFKCTITLP